MKKNLLNKTLNAYLILALVIVLVAAPLFYFVMEKLYIEDADEALMLRKEEFLHYPVSSIKLSEIALWNKINSNAKIERNESLTKDSLYYHFFFDSLANENEPYRVLVSPVIIEGKPYTFLARINLVETEDLIKSIALLFCFVIVIAFIGFYIVTKRLSIRLWRPFYATLEQIEQFEIDKLIVPEFSDSDTAEFHRLNNSIKNLIERNTIIYKSQQEFIENAAHELQTPLAVFQVKLETLMQHPDLTPDQADILLTLTESASRLNRLNKNLLLLSKIDNSHYSERERVSLKSIIEKQQEFFMEQATEKNLTITIDINEDAIIKSNIILSEILVSNLFLNAIRHNVQDGFVKVLLTQNTLEISNTGSQNLIPSEKLFQRFSKTNHFDKGSGLGLAIVKKVTDLNNWKINYTFQNNLHYFIVKF